LADGCDIEEGRGAFEWEGDDGDDPNIYFEERNEWGFYISRKWRRKQKTPDANANFGGPAR
jgi:hypothetical protein